MNMDLNFVRCECMYNVLYKYVRVKHTSCYLFVKIRCILHLGECLSLLVFSPSDKCSLC